MVAALILWMNQLLKYLEKKNWHPKCFLPGFKITLWSLTLINFTSYLATLFARESMFAMRALKTLVIKKLLGVKIDTSKGDLYLTLL